jgi:hypothetical protein
MSEEERRRTREEANAFQARVKEALRLKRIREAAAHDERLAILEEERVQNISYYENLEAKRRWTTENEPLSKPKSIKEMVAENEARVAKMERERLESAALYARLEVSRRSGREKSKLYSLKQEDATTPKERLAQFERERLASAAKYKEAAQQVVALERASVPKKADRLCELESFEEERLAKIERERLAAEAEEAARLASAVKETRLRELEILEKERLAADAEEAARLASVVKEARLRELESLEKERLDKIERERLAAEAVEAVRLATLASKLAEQERLAMIEREKLALEATRAAVAERERLAIIEREQLALEAARAAAAEEARISISLAGHWARAQVEEATEAALLAKKQRAAQDKMIARKTNDERVVAPPARKPAAISVASRWSKNLHAAEAQAEFDRIFRENREATHRAMEEAAIMAKLVAKKVEVSRFSLPRHCQY